MAGNALSFVSSLWNQTGGRISMAIAAEHPADDRDQRGDDSDDDESTSCSSDPPLPTTNRTEFGPQGGVIYGYPSTGGVLIKKADPVDFLFLSLSCLDICDRAKDTETEDRFCRQMLQVGASWWPSKRLWGLSYLDDRYMTKEQSKIMVYGWPPDRQGVWVLRYNDKQQLPDDFGRITLVTSMQAKIEVMKSLNAIFVDDVSQIEELDLQRLPRGKGEDSYPMTIHDLKDKWPLFIVE